MIDFYKWAFVGFTVLVFCAIWPSVEQPSVQMTVYQIGGLLLWAVLSIKKPLRDNPKEQMAAFALIGASLLIHRTQGAFLAFTQVFIASVIYHTIATKVERDWIIDALFISSLIQLPVAIGQVFGYDPIFQYKLAPAVIDLSRQATGFIGKRSELCIFLATVSMLKLTHKKYLYGLILSVFVFAFKGIAGMGGIMVSWLAWALRQGKYYFFAILLACVCVLAPNVNHIIQTKSTVRLLVWKPFFDASFSKIYAGFGPLSTSNDEVYVALSKGNELTLGWMRAWGNIKNSYLTLFFEMGLLGILLIVLIFIKPLKLYKLRQIPTSFYAFLVLAFSSFFQVTHLYPSLAYLWILVLALVHMDHTESKKEAICGFNT